MVFLTSKYQNRVVSKDINGTVVWDIMVLSENRIGGDMNVLKRNSRADF